MRRAFSASILLFEAVATGARFRRAIADVDLVEHAAHAVAVEAAVANAAGNAFVDRLFHKQSSSFPFSMRTLPEIISRRAENPLDKRAHFG